MEELNKEHKHVYPLFRNTLRPSIANTKEQKTSQLPLNGGGVDAIQIIPTEVPKQVSDKTRGTAKSHTSHTEIEGTSSTAQRAVNGELLELDPNNSRRKRRKTASPDIGNATGGSKMALGVKGQTTLDTARIQPLTKHDDGPSLNAKPDIQERLDLSSITQDKTATQWCQGSFFTKREAAATAQEIRSAKECSVPSSDSRQEILTENTTTKNSKRHLPNIDPEDARPKRILRLNPITGTIGSPPSKKATNPERATGQELPRRRGRKAKCLTVTIRYGSGQPLPANIGLKIDGILRSRRRNSLVDREYVLEPLQLANSAPAQPAKALHPLFLGKTAKPAVVIRTPEACDQATTSDDPKESRIVEVGNPPKVDRIQPLSRNPPLPSAKSRNTGEIMKFPGTMEPAWPWQGMVHLRGRDPNISETQSVDHSGFDLPSNVKKSKYQAVEVMAHEDTLNRLADHLCAEEIMRGVKEIRSQNFAPIPSCLRVPVKHLESGLALQRRVRTELRIRLSHSASQIGSSEDELSGLSSAARHVHPALTKIYESIPVSLSAFDVGECETQAWTLKYAPKSAAEILQTGKEAYILKEWLQTLTVKAVESVSADGPQSRSSSVSRKSGNVKSENRLPKKRKSKKLEGFVVSSEDEEDDMDEISEPEDDVSLHGSLGLLKKTVIRAGDLARGGKEPGRLTNAIVISGPHGCGKTAAVYAIAKELGFEVFEINASSKRSGKDILEKVGDMTRNHLVQRSQHQAAALPGDEADQQASEVLANEIKSGRQGTMNSFFKPQASTKPKAKVIKSAAAKTATTEPKDKAQAKSPPKPQKQSLILLEEVDVLYEEDKQFWATVVTLIAQSKRPIIMTCNDESLVPFQALSLHAIIRFTPPPVDLAVDYMLLIAACEGHAIKREAVKALYESRNMDLRASLTELDFWCQFAIGDPKNGLAWYYSRWPVGDDVDEHGDTIRVVSEDSFETGMGWLSQDFLEDDQEAVALDEELLHEAWNGWHLDVQDLHYKQTHTALIENVQRKDRSKSGDRGALCKSSDMAEALSAADIFSGVAFASGNQVLIDSTLPQLSNKVREDYVLGRELLEASPIVNYDSLGTDICLWIKARAREHLRTEKEPSSGISNGKRRSQSTELVVQQLIRSRPLATNSSIARRDFSLAFDPISEPEKTSLYNPGVLEASVFDRTTTIIATDVAPYIRSIVSYDARLQEERTRMSNLLSEGGRRTKRMRTTRAAMSALEGGARSTTRRDKYFGNELNPYFVLKTGRKEWLDAVLTETAGATWDGRRSSKAGSEASMVEEGIMGDHRELGELDGSPASRYERI